MRVRHCEAVEGDWSPLLVEDVQTNVLGALVSETAVLVQHQAAKKEKRDRVGPSVFATDRVSVSCPH